MIRSGGWVAIALGAFLSVGCASTREPPTSTGPPPAAVTEPEENDPDPIQGFNRGSFATNEFLDVFANRDLFLNAIRWLVGDVERIAVRQNQARSSTLSMTSTELQAIQYLSLFVLPEGIALIGVLVWWRRRS